MTREEVAAGFRRELEWLRPAARASLSTRSLLRLIEQAIPLIEAEALVPHAEGDGFGSNTGEPKSRTGGARGPVTHAELAKELRRQRELFAMNTEPAGAAVIPPAARGSLTVVLEDAAAALEEEDKDARRYGVLRRCSFGPHKGASYKIDEFPPGEISLILSNAFVKDYPEGAHGWYSTLDAAIDAYTAQKETQR